MQNNLYSDKVELSLVIPTYNRSDLIAETLKSALSQTTPFAEIIVVDDGSTDDTLKVLQDFGDRIQVIGTSNNGVQAARNKGVTTASSKYVTLCDSDDILETDYVASVSSWLSKNPQCNILYSNFITFDKHRTHADKFSKAPPGFFDGSKREGDFISDIPDLYKRVISFQPLFPSGATCQKSFYEYLGGYDTAFNKIGAEDWEFTLRAICHGNVGLCTRPLTRIRKHVGNDSADSMRMSMGEAKILEHALIHHPAAAEHTPLIRASINRRLVGAFDAAFARGDFNTAVEILPLLTHYPRHLKFRVKKNIVSLPSAIRNIAWRITQIR